MNELGNLISRRLKIPVDSGIDYGTFAEIIYKGRNVGTVQLVPTPGNLIIDDTPQSISNISWEFIYESNREELNNLIAEYFKIPTDDLEITRGTFRNLYVRDAAANLLGNVSCSYENEQWTIQVIN